MQKQTETCQQFLLYLDIDQFYSNDHTPIHVHVIKGRAKAKYNLFPVELIDNHGFKSQELKLIESIIEENVETIAQHWNMFFNNNK